MAIAIAIAIAIAVTVTVTVTATETVTVLVIAIVIIYLMSKCLHNLSRQRLMLKSYRAHQSILIKTPHIKIMKMPVTKVLRTGLLKI